MNIYFSNSFKKQYKRVPEKIKINFGKKLNLFCSNQFSPALNNHQLKGVFNYYRSINITGDWRAIYHLDENGNAYFIALGTHSQLYS